MNQFYLEEENIDGMQMANHQKMKMMEPDNDLIDQNRSISQNRSVNQTEQNKSMN